MNPSPCLYYQDTQKKPFQKKLPYLQKKFSSHPEQITGIKRKLIAGQNQARVGTHERKQKKKGEITHLFPIGQNVGKMWLFLFTS